MVDKAIREDIGHQTYERLHEKFGYQGWNFPQVVVDTVLEVIGWEAPEPVCSICGSECPTCIPREELTP